MDDLMPENIEAFVLTIIAFLVIIIFGGSIYAFAHAIVLFIFSAGDTEKIKTAWNSIRYMILGVFLTLFFLFVFPLIFKRLGFANYQDFSANQIFSHTSYILQSLFNFGKEATIDYQNNSGPIRPIPPGSQSNNSSSGSTGGVPSGSTSGGGTNQGDRQLEL